MRVCWLVGATWLCTVGGLSAQTAEPETLSVETELAAEAKVQEPLMHRSAGPVLSLGLGAGYGIAGGQLGYAFPVTDLAFQVVPFVGLGRVPRSEEARGRWVSALGAQLVYGRSNRTYVEFAVAGLGARRWSRYGVRVATDVVYGGSVLFGYEYLCQVGFLLRFGLGGGLAFYDRTSEWIWNGALALGWKLW